MTESSRRDRNDRGFALIAALMLAVLYLSLMELALRDATETIRQGHRFRARIVSEVLAENAAELAAEQMLALAANEASLAGADGTGEALYTRLPGDRFEVRAEGTAAGVVSVTTRLVLRGRFDGKAVRIVESETR